MTITIEETGQTRDLSTWKTGIDLTVPLLHMYGWTKGIDWTDNDGAIVMTQSKFEYWSKKIEWIVFLRDIEASIRSNFGNDFGQGLLDRMYEDITDTAANDTKGLFDVVKKHINALDCAIERCEDGSFWIGEIAETKKAPDEMRDAKRADILASKKQEKKKRDQDIDMIKNIKESRILMEWAQKNCPQPAPEAISAIKKQTILSWTELKKLAKELRGDPIRPQWQKY